MLNADKPLQLVEGVRVHTCARGWLLARASASSAFTQIPTYYTSTHIFTWVSLNFYIAIEYGSMYRNTRYKRPAYMNNACLLNTCVSGNKYVNIMDTHKHYGRTLFNVCMYVCKFFLFWYFMLIFMHLTINIKVALLIRSNCLRNCLL